MSSDIIYIKVTAITQLLAFTYQLIRTTIALMAAHLKQTFAKCKKEGRVSFFYDMLVWHIALPKIILILVYSPHW